MNRERMNIIWSAALAILSVFAKMYPNWTINDIIDDIKKK